MNTVFIVLPILTLLMFDLGLELRPADFALVFRRPRPVVAGLIGQILLLPAIAYAVGTLLGLEGAMFVGLMLIACCPGGSSSNVFSGLAGGDVALSVSLTALSSAVTLVTLPLFMGSVVELPVASLVMQNLVVVLLPVVVGMAVRGWRAPAAERIHGVLRRLAFPLLMFLAAVFFVANRGVIIANFGTIGTACALMIALAMAAGSAMSALARGDRRVRRTLVIEVGMQNAAQAIALAASPIVFNDAAVAVPAIVYALVMNVALLIYVGVASAAAICPPDARA